MELTEGGERDKAKGEQVFGCGLFEAETLLTFEQIINEWYAQESAKETWEDLTLSLTCCRYQFLVYSITVMLLPLLHLQDRSMGCIDPPTCKASND